MASKRDEDPAADIAAAAANPQPAPDLAGELAQDAEPVEAVAGVRELPKDCPITPLGFLKQKYYFLDFACQLIELGSEFRKGELMALFGTRMGWMDGFWPQWKKVSEKGGEGGGPLFERDGFSQKHAQQGLIMACSKAGLFNPKGKVRGRGAHRGDKGELVLHCGDKVLVGGKKGVKDRLKGSASYSPGLVAGYVYPRLDALPPPAEEAASKAVCRQILTELESWNWTRGRMAAYLLFCWIATASIGGALKHRPHGWIVGPSGAGKTTLQDFLRLLMGDWGVSTEDATEAGVRQLLDQDTLAVMFDEIEAEEDNQEVVGRIVRLARLAYSGASALRGTSEQLAKQFVARSCFLFSSIHHHEMPAQDRNRIAVLQLSQFPANTPKFVLPELTVEWGHQLRRRLVEQWPRYDATLAAYQKEMLTQGYLGREQDTYGTLLACGDLMLYDGAPPDAAAASQAEDADRVFKAVRALANIADAARIEAESTTERCVKHLASHRLPARPGENQETVARWLQRHYINLYNRRETAATATRAKLGTHGLRLVHLAKGHDEGNGQGGLIDAYLAGDAKSKIWVAVANKTNKGMQEIFAGSSWPKGVWTQALSGVDGAWQNKKSRFAGGPAEGCVLVPLDVLIDVEGTEAEAIQVGRDGGE